MPFTGLPRETQGFLRQLADNNRKEWFEAHRAEFDALCVQPMLDLAAALVPVCDNLDPPHRCEPKFNGSLRRIHRDTRFSKDKSPYHDHLHLIFWTGDHPTRSPGIHVVIGANGFGMGAGYWAFEGEALERFRDALCEAQPAAELRKALDAMAGFGQTPDAPVLKKPPAGRVARDGLDQLLLSKGLVVRTQADQPIDEALHGAGAIDWLRPQMQAGAAINRWIARRVLA